MYAEDFFMSGKPWLSDVKPGQSLGFGSVFTSLPSELLCFFLAPLSFLFCLLCICYICLISVIFVSLGQSCLPYAEQRFEHSEHSAVRHTLTWHIGSQELCMQLSNWKIMWGGRELKIRKGGVIYNWWHSSWDGQAEKSRLYVTMAGI